jgi:hypothetical protein
MVHSISNINVFVTRIIDTNDTNDTKIVPRERSEKIQPSHEHVFLFVFSLFFALFAFFAPLSFSINSLTFIFYFFRVIRFIRNKQFFQNNKMNHLTQQQQEQYQKYINAIQQKLITPDQIIIDLVKSKSTISEAEYFISEVRKAVQATEPLVTYQLLNALYIRTSEQAAAFGFAVLSCMTNLQQPPQLTLADQLKIAKYIEPTRRGGDTTPSKMAEQNQNIRDADDAIRTAMRMIGDQIRIIAGETKKKEAAQHELLVIEAALKIKAETQDALTLAAAEEKELMKKKKEEIQRNAISNVMKYATASTAETKKNNAAFTTPHSSMPLDDLPIKKKSNKKQSKKQAEEVDDDDEESNALAVSMKTTSI